jgi:hypothetical protein
MNSSNVDRKNLICRSSGLGAFILTTAALTYNDNPHKKRISRLIPLQQNVH